MCIQRKKKKRADRRRSACLIGCVYELAMLGWVSATTKRHVVEIYLSASHHGVAFCSNLEGLEML
jgi:hypothetical protein